MPPQLSPPYEDSRRPQLVAPAVYWPLAQVLGQRVSQPQVAGPVRAADLALLVRLPQVAVATAADMETGALPAAEMVAVVAMAQALMMAIPAHMATSREESDRRNDEPPP